MSNISSSPVSKQPAELNALYTYNNPWKETLLGSFKPCPRCKFVFSTNKKSSSEIVVLFSLIPAAIACFCLPCYSSLLVRRGGDHLLTCLINPYSLMNLRTKVRAAFQIQVKSFDRDLLLSFNDFCVFKGSFIEDCLTTSCLGPCAAMQIEKELDSRNIPAKPGN